MMGTNACCPPAPKLPRALRVAGWNALLLTAGLVLIAIAWEAYMRLTTPSMTEFKTRIFDPEVGILYTPNTDIRVTNRIDFWTVSRVNSWGFLDREPPDPTHAAERCLVAMIGDSVVAAEQVPISDKFHVRFESLAAQQSPHLDVTTQAFGVEATGQIAQLPYYDKFARRLHPKLVVLVFVVNDFYENAREPRYKERLPYVHVESGVDGSLKLRPPDPDYEFPAPGVGRRLVNVARISYFLQWLDTKRDTKVLWRQPPKSRKFQNVLHFTSFALDQFKERVERDGASLAILTSHTMSRHGAEDRLKALAKERGIPLISQYDYIIRHGRRKDARWTHDAHWNPTGHRWAAEALFEWFEKNPQICGTAEVERTL